MKRAVAFPILALLVIAITGVANYAVYQAGIEWFVQKPSLMVVGRNVLAVAVILFGGWLLLPRDGRKRSAETILLAAATLFGIGLAVQFRLGHDAPRQLSNGAIVALRDSVHHANAGASIDSLRRLTSRLVRGENGGMRREFDASRIDTRLARSLERAYGPTPDTRAILDDRQTATADNPFFRFLPVLALLIAAGVMARGNLATLLSARWRIAGFYGSLAICLLTLGYLVSTGGVRGANFAPQEMLKLSLPVAWAGLLIHYRGAFQPETRERFARSPLVLWLYVLALLSSPLVVFVLVRDFGQFLVISIAQTLLLAYFTRSALYVVLFAAGLLASSVILIGPALFGSTSTIMLVLGIVLAAMLAIAALERFRRRDALWTSASLVLVAYVAVAAAAVQLPFVGRMLSTPRERFLLWADLFSRHGNAHWWDHAQQVVEALHSFDAGRLLGHGLGYGTPFLIPKAASDFVFAAIGEELGFTGAAMVILLFVALAAVGLRIARDLGGDSFPALLVAGYTLLLVAQAFVHITGTMNILPMTGITLPLVSSGMSSLVVSWGIIGLMIGLSARAANQAEKLVIVER
ncbi:MAG: FtsW/RodA/SpoVE family cell cycle protein [Candidatus Kapaibacterium sp.]